MMKKSLFVLSALLFSALNSWARPEIDSPKYVAVSFLADYDPRYSENVHGAYELFEKLPANITPIVAVPSDILKTMLQSYFDKKKQSAEIVVAEPGTKWARDFFPEFVPDGKGSGTFVGFRYTRGDTSARDLLKAFGQHFKLKTKRLNLVLEGGNLVFDKKRRLYITEKVVKANTEAEIKKAADPKTDPNVGDVLDLKKDPITPKNKTQIEALLKKELKASEVIWLPLLEAKLEVTGHSDMLMNFISEDTVTVIQSKPYIDPDDDKMTTRNIENSKAMNVVLDKIANLLESKGFNVVRVPAVKTSNFLLSSANSLNIGSSYFVVKSKIKGLQEYNSEVTKAFKGLVNLKSITMDTFQEQGSLHCLTKTYPAFDQ